MVSSHSGTPLSHSQRSNEQWIADLSGDNGYDAQEKAYLNLSRYLYAVVYRYLDKRSGSIHVLASFSDDELSELAEDFVQDAIEKLARGEHALLAQFSGKGSFTSWVAQIAKRIAATEIRRPFWDRRNRFGSDNIDEESDPLESGGPSEERHVRSDSNPEFSLEQQELGEAILGCRDSLSLRYREIFDRLIVDSEPVESVAESLDITVNAIYMLVFRVKRNMRKCLSKKGYGPDED